MLKTRFELGMFVLFLRQIRFAAAFVSIALVAAAPVEAATLL